MPGSNSSSAPGDAEAGSRLDSWKEIAAYLQRDVRTVRRWEKSEGLPIHRHVHGKGATVYAYEAELDGWLKGRGQRKNHVETALADNRRPYAFALAIIAVALVASSYFFWIRPALLRSDTSAALRDDAAGSTYGSPQYSVLFADLPFIQPDQWASFDISPNGDRSVFFTERDEDPGQFYLYEQAGSVVRPLIDDVGQWRGFRLPTWSPSGELIAFAASRLAGSEADTAGGVETWVPALFVVSPDGGTPRQIGPSLPGVRGLCWTPDGRGLTYADNDGLHTVSLDGSGVLPMPGDTAAPYFLGGYSPDGRWLTIKVPSKSTSSGRRAEIWLRSTVGDESVHLATALGLDVGLAWSPDSSSLYYVSDASGEPNIWRLKIDLQTGVRQGDPVQVTFFNGARLLHLRAVDGGRRIAFVFLTTERTIHVADASDPTDSRSVAGGEQPQLSPSGQILYFRKSGPDGSGVYALTLNGGTLLRLADYAPFSLSPDGATIAYVLQEGSEATLFTVSTRGGEPQTLAEFGAQRHAVPHWSPDGSLLAYADDSGLFVLPFGGGAPKRLAESPSLFAVTLRWSPDGEFIAALGHPSVGEGRANAVFVVPASGGEPRQLTPAVVSKEGLEWHPDGRSLTYHMSQSDSETLQVFLDGRPPSLFLNQPEHWDYVGKWAPDGRRFFFLSFADDGPRLLYVYDEVTGDLSLFAYDAQLPAWSRDGGTMAWVTQKETRQLWAMSDFR